MPDSTRSIAFKNEIAELASARRALRDFLRDHGAGEPAQYAVDLVLEELVGNTIRYGYEEGSQGRREIRVELSVADGRISFESSDDARPFDPTIHPEPEAAPSVAAAPIGGLGISMVRRLVSAMSYRREGGRNRLSIELPAS